MGLAIPDSTSTSHALNTTGTAVKPFLQITGGLIAIPGGLIDKATVNHVDDAIHGKGCLCNICRNDNPSIRNYNVLISVF